MKSKSLRRGSILQRAVVETLDKRVLLSGSPNEYFTIEAENFDNSVATTHAWVPYSQGGFNGSGVRAMESDKTKIEFGSASSAPRLDYNLNFATAGSYYVWVRGIGFDGNSDSVHLGVNGVPQVSAGNIAVRREGVKWSRFSTEIGASATLLFNAGAQTISLFMRESGTSVDAIKLTTDKAYRPDQEASIPTISIAPSTPSSGTITEGSDDGITYTLSRSTAFGDLPVAVSLFSGTADADDYIVSGENVDYDAASGAFTVTFKGTETQASFTVHATADVEGDEGDENLTLVVDESSGDSYRVAGGTETTTTIKDVPVVTIEPASESGEPIREGESGKAAFVVKRSNNNGPLSVRVRVPAVLQGTVGIAAPVADYSVDGYILGPNHDEFVVSWAANDATLEKTICLTANVDALPEPEETVTAYLYDNGSEVDEYVFGDANEATMSIIELPVISIVATTSETSEDDPDHPLVFEFRARQLLAGESVFVSYGFGQSRPEDAETGVDYDVVGSGATATPGIVQLTYETPVASIQIVPIDNSIADGDKLVHVILFDDYQSTPTYNVAPMLALFAPDEIATTQPSTQESGDAQGLIADNEKLLDIDVDGVKEADEEKDGGWVLVNADNDNGSTVTDHVPAKRDFDAGETANENDLKKVLLTTTATEGKVRLSVTKMQDARGIIKIWNSPTKTSEIAPDTEWDVANVPGEIWVEGIKEGAIERETSLKVELVQGADVVAHDGAKISVGPILKELRGIGNSDTGGYAFAGKALYAVKQGKNGKAPIQLSASASAADLNGGLRLTVLVKHTQNIAQQGGAAVGAQVDHPPNQPANAAGVKSYDWGGANAGKYLLDGLTDEGPFFTSNEKTQVKAGEHQTTANDNPKIWLNSPPPGGNQVQGLPNAGSILPGKKNLFSTYNITFDYSIYATWQLKAPGADRTKDVIYSLGKADYSVVWNGLVGFNPNNGQPAVQFLNGDQIVDSGPFTRTNAEPLALKGPTANDGAFAWR